MTLLQEDDVAALLPVHALPRALEAPDGFSARDDGQLGHQTFTSTSRVATVSGMPLAARASRHA
jgi:hypothetical protein